MWRTSEVMETNETVYVVVCRDYIDGLRWVKGIGKALKEVHGRRPI
jgi:hypothetical protein